MENELELKSKFAFELLRANVTDSIGAFKIALSIFPNDTGVALRVANEWVKDPIVIAEQQRLADELGELAFLPTKIDLSRAIWEKANKEYTCTEDFTKLMRLYAEVRGFIEKPTTNIQNNLISNNKVMIVTDHGNDNEWETKLKEQQRVLRLDSAR
jgi:hypothetical protein